MEETTEKVKIVYTKMIKDGYRNVTMFRFDEYTEEIPEGYYGWNWISERKINL